MRSWGDKLFTLLGPIRIYPEASSLIDVIALFFVDFAAMLRGRRPRLANMARFFCQLTLGLLLLPVSLILAAAGFRVIYGTAFNQIGEAQLLDAAIREHLLLNRRRKLILVLGACQKGNRFLIKQYDTYLRVCEWPSISALFWSILSYNPLIHHDVVTYNVAHENSKWSQLNRIWIKQGRPPLLEPPYFGGDWSQFPEGLITALKSKQFVCVHSRDSGCYGWASRTTRDYDINTLVPLINCLGRIGLAVFRSGSKPQYVIPPGRLDYPSLYFDACDLTAQDQDVYMFSNCLFYLGCSSGPAEVPGTFGKNVYLTNVYPIVNGLRFLPGDLSVFKKIREVKTGKLLPFKNYFKPPFAQALQRPQLAQMGYHLEDNTEEEIMAGFIEFIAGLQDQLPREFGNIITAENESRETRPETPACASSRYLRKHHWSYRAAGIYGKAFMQLVGYQDLREAGQSSVSSILSQN
jgi:putative glycosyltransferase (TIGR04372 family)